MRTTVSISGMTCAHCVRAVFTSLAGVPGIDRADVSIGKAIIEHDGSVTPEQIPDLLALWGDSSDNIPGAPGIGEKGARDLIQKYPGYGAV